MRDSFELSCPAPISDSEIVQLAHGGGGRLTHELIDRVFSRFNTSSTVRHDGAYVDLANRRLAFTTDSYVIQPIFFPGGDIGKLAVYGTINDLAMCGARPLCLSAGFILEAGLKIDTLSRVVDSMRQAAAEVGVEIVTGDTKVVERGRCDSVYINTSGIGLLESRVEISPIRISPGDRVILSGDLARHALAVMSVRAGLEFETVIESDLAPLHEPALGLLERVDVKCMRDLTRGGLAAALNELAVASRTGFTIDERAVPVREDVRGGCEFLGLDPLHMANEGRFIAIVAAEDVPRALEVLRGYPVSEGAVEIGAVTDSPQRVRMRSLLGTLRVIDLPSGEQLPRIC